MRIDGISGVPQPDNGKKGEKSNKVERSNEDTFVRKGLKIDFKTFISMASNVDETARAQKVDQIKTLVESGQYSVNIDNIVKKMMKDMGEL